MAARWIELITGSMEQRRRYRRYKTRTRRLPANYRAAVEAVERYLLFSGGITKADTAASMLEDLADLFEQSAANRTPIRSVVGEDPVEFAETFLRNYADGQWINKERERLKRTIARVATDDTDEQEADR